MAHLLWWPELGYGYYPVQDTPYDESYFTKYEYYKLTPLGVELNQARVEIVDRYLNRSSEVVDIGIGAGHFVEIREGNTHGYDVNPIGIKWLKDREIFFDPYEQAPANISCWDSLEHIKHPDRLISRVKEHVFVSIPIFMSGEDVVTSKHYRKDEHYWYFTDWGLVAWFKKYHFKLVMRSDIETSLGREGIGTYVFRRE